MVMVVVGVGCWLMIVFFVWYCVFCRYIVWELENCWVDEVFLGFMFVMWRWFEKIWLFV